MAFACFDTVGDVAAAAVVVVDVVDDDVDVEHNSDVEFVEFDFCCVLLSLFCSVSFEVLLLLLFVEFVLFPIANLRIWRMTAVALYACCTKEYF